MSDLKPTGTKIKLGKNEYGLRFDVNAINDIQDHFDIAIANLGNLFKNEREVFRNITYLLTVLINEDIDCKNDDCEIKASHLEERYVSRYVDPNNLEEMISCIYKAFKNSNPKAEDDESPNMKSE